MTHHNWKGLASLAWREVRVNAAYPEWDVRLAMYVKKPDPGEVDPPAWFRRSLLVDDEPSMDWYLNNLARINRAALVQLGTDAPRQGATYPVARRRRPRVVVVRRRPTHDHLCARVQKQIDELRRLARGA